MGWVGGGGGGGGVCFVKLPTCSTMKDCGK